MTRSLTASPIHQVDQMDPKSVQRAKPPTESATTPAVALIVVLRSAASPASLKTSPHALAHPVPARETG